MAKLYDAIKASAAKGGQPVACEYGLVLAKSAPEDGGWELFLGGCNGTRSRAGAGSFF
jgi:hypothetical protein